MTVLKKILRGITGPVTRSILSPSQRYFTTLVASGAMYLTHPSITFTGDFRRPFLFTMPTSSPSGDEWILGSSGSLLDLLGINAAGNMRLRIAGGGLLSSASTLPFDGKLHSGVLERISSTVTVTVDETLFITTSESGSSTWDRIGTAGNGTQSFNGIIANIPMVDVATLERIYNIKESWAGGSTNLIDSSGNGQDGVAVNITEANADLFTLQSNGDYLGAQMVREADIVNSPWVSLGNNRYSIDGTNISSVSVSFSPGFLKANTVTKVEIKISNYVSGVFRLNNGSGNSSQLSSDGVFFLNFLTSTATNLNFQALGASCEYDIEIRSINRLLEIA